MIDYYPKLKARGNKKEIRREFIKDLPACILFVLFVLVLLYFAL